LSVVEASIETGAVTEISMSNVGKKVCDVGAAVVVSSTIAGTGWLKLCEADTVVCAVATRWLLARGIGSEGVGNAGVTD
jgi:hypothetical protein